MIQELFRIGPLSISPFGVMLVAAFLAAFFQLHARHEAARRRRRGGRERARVRGRRGRRSSAPRSTTRSCTATGGCCSTAPGSSGTAASCSATAAIVWTMRRRRLPRWPTADAAGAGARARLRDRPDRLLPRRRRLRRARPTCRGAIAFPVGLPPTTGGDLRRDFGVALPESVAATRPSSASIRRSSTRRRWRSPSGASAWRCCAAASPRRRTALAVLALLAVERFGRVPARQGRPLPRPAAPWRRRSASPAGRRARALAWPAARRRRRARRRSPRDDSAGAAGHASGCSPSPAPTRAAARASRPTSRPSPRTAPTA